EITHGIVFGEGPVWDRRQGRLLFTEIIGDTIWQWRPGVGTERLVHPSSHANGMTFDREGRLVVAGWSARTIWRVEPDGTFTTLASRYDGKKVNSPNDIVVRRDGLIYFTDSPGGLVIPGMVGEDLQRHLDVQGVFCVTQAGEVHLAIADCVYPNGLAFSTDETLLYVNDTRLGLIRAFDVRPDGSLGPGREFHRLTGNEPGVADGMKVDVRDTVDCTGPGGIHVMDSGGTRLRRRAPAGQWTHL